MASGADVGCSIFMVLIAGPIIMSVLPWYEFFGDSTLGIDLGTTYSVASLCKKKQAIPVAVEGSPLVPSMVSYRDGAVDVGVRAEEIQLDYPEEVVLMAKRFMGKQSGDERVENELKDLPFPLVEGKNGFIAAEIGGRKIMPEEVGGKILKKLKDSAERQVGYWKHLMGFRFTQATVTVPVSFDGQQKAATHRAAKEAGFSLVRLVEEPVAAAVAYGLQAGSDDLDVLVYDMGGGTLDVALLRLQRDTNTFIIMGTTGSPNLGGTDFDKCLLSHISESRTPSLSSLTPQTRAHLLKEVELAKRNLSEATSTTVDTPWGPVPISREDLKMACSELISRALEPVDEAMQLSIAEEDEVQVVLAGGSSRLVAVRELLIERFGKDRVHSNLDADMAISLGASMAYEC